jgi:hypothetical protein
MNLTPLYVFGTPASVGGAATKLRDLLELIRSDFEIHLVVAHDGLIREKSVRRFAELHGLRLMSRRDFPRKAQGVALAVCEEDFFTSGTVERVRTAGLPIVWSNDMMWPFKGEVEAAARGDISRVVYVSEIQREELHPLHSNVPDYLIPNYINPNAFVFRERQNPVFTIGRLSRPDPIKYPVEFPLLYEMIGIRDVRYRVQAWSPELSRIYSWHRFGAEWELLKVGALPASEFLGQLDLFVYPLGHRVRESWGRSTVEAMLTGAVPVVPGGHYFDRLMTHGESGFVFESYATMREIVLQLHQSAPLRRKVSSCAAEDARRRHCDSDTQRQMWLEVLAF